MSMKTLTAVLACAAAAFVPLTSSAQIGTRFPSEKKIIPDPVTGIPLHFLTTASVGDSKIYPTHHQWTADGKWVIFRSSRVPGEALAVNEETGDIVQITERGYTGMLCSSHKSNKLYLMRSVHAQVLPRRDQNAEAGRPLPTPGTPSDATKPAATTTGKDGEKGAEGAQKEARREWRRPRGPFQVVEVDLERVFADSAAGKMKPAAEYERICGTVPEEYITDGNMDLDATEEFVYFRVTGEAVNKKLPEGQKPAEKFGPRNMGAGPTGLASMNLTTGEVKHIVTVPFQIGHVQTNPWYPGEIVFCWETGGKAPTRMWTVMADGTGLRPVYPEQDFEWVTHEAVIGKDEVAFAIIALRKPMIPGQPEPENVKQAGPGWGPAGSSDHPTGLAIANLRTREMRIVSQLPPGDPGRSFWHVHGSPDGRWAVGDDFQYRTWIVDRTTGETRLLADNGHKTTAADHQHPTFSPDGKKLNIQSAMLSENGRSMNIVVIHVPDAWLKRTYPVKFE